MKLRLCLAAAVLIVAQNLMATVEPIVLSTPPGSGLSVAYDEASDVYTLTAGSLSMPRIVQTNAIAAPWADDIRYLKFDYLTTDGFVDIKVMLYKGGTDGTRTDTRTFAGSFEVSPRWQSYHYDVRALRRVTPKLGLNAGQYQTFELAGLPEGAIVRLRNLRWASDEEVYVRRNLGANSEIVIEAEDFNRSINAVTHTSRQIDYPERPVYKNPTGDRLPIFAWCGPDFGSGYQVVDGVDLLALELKKDYQEMAECGFNCTLGTAWPGVDQAALFTGSGVNGTVPIHLLEGLDVKLLIKAGLDSDPSLAAKYKSSEYLAGYFIADEPLMSQLPGMRTKLEKLRQYDSDHLFYGNLLNMGNSMKAVGASCYEEYVREYVRQVGLGFLSFDYYPVRQLSATGEIVLMPDYFRNLEIVARMAKYYDMPFWSFAHSVASNCMADGMVYPTPTEEHIRVQVFMSLAYGAQGIQYFTYTCPNDASYNYHDSPIDKDGNKTPVWYMVQNVNRDIIALNDVFLGAEMLWMGYTHAETPEGCVRLTSDMLPAGVALVASDGSGVAVSLLQNGRKQYLMVVNPDIHNAQNVTVTLSDKVLQIKADGSSSEVSGPQAVVMRPGDHLIYLVNDNAPERETYDRPEPFDRADYRSDVQDVIIAGDDNASGCHFLPDMGDRNWNSFSAVMPDGSGHVVGEDDAIANWGAVFHYNLNVDEDMEVNISVGHSVPWSEYGRVASTGAVPGFGYVVEKNPSLNWPKAYAASMKLEIDGVEIAPANQPLRPAVPDVFDPAGTEFNSILADRSRWVSTASNGNEPANVLYFWPKEGGRDDVEFIYNEEPDYVNVPLSAGEHVIKVKSMSYPWHFDALKISSGQSGIGYIQPEGDEVVSSRYFDLQGRQLESAPQNGLYLRRDIHANGVTTTVKVLR